MNGHLFGASHHPEGASVTLVGIVGVLLGASSAGYFVLRLLGLFAPITS